jgi:hypothetical protein
MFAGCKVLETREEASIEAKRILEDIEYAEYGICTITVNDCFYQGWELEMDALHLRIEKVEKACADEWLKESTGERLKQTKSGVLTTEEIEEAVKWIETLPGPFSPCGCDKCGLIWNLRTGLDVVHTNTNSVEQPPISTEDVVAMKRKVAFTLNAFPRVVKELQAWREKHQCWCQVPDCDNKNHRADDSCIPE